MAGVEGGLSFLPAMTGMSGMSGMANTGFSWDLVPSLLARFAADEDGSVLTKTCARFDGSNYLSASQSVATAAPLTVCLWRKGTVTGRTSLSLSDTAGTTNYYVLDVKSTGAARLIARDSGSGEIECTAGTTAADGNWHFLAGRITSATSRHCWLDATKSTESTTSVTPASIDTVTVGCLVRTSAAYYDIADIDNVLVWTRALTDDQITWVYTDKPSYYVLANSTDANNPGITGLVMGYPLDEQSGTRRNAANAAGPHLTEAGTAFGMSFASASSQYAEVDAAPTSAYPYAMGCCFKRATDIEGALIWVGDKDSETDWIALRVDADGDILAQARTAATAYASVAALNDDTNVWHFAAGVFGSSTSRVAYGDAVVGTPETTSVVIDTTFDRISLGRLGDSSPGGYLNGSLDNAWIYQGGTALTAAQVNWLRTGGKTGGPATYRDVRQSTHADNPGLANLKAWYKLNEASGVLVNVHNPGTYDLTTYNTPTYQASGYVIDYPDYAAGYIEEYAGMEDRALSFVAASTQYLETDTAAVTAYPFSITGAFKISAPPAENKEMLFIGDKDVDNENARFSISTDGYVMVRSQSNLVASATVPVNKADGAWHFTTGVWSAANSRTAYVDAETPVTDTTSKAATGWDRTTIGRAGDLTPGGYLDGTLDNLAIWSAALTAANHAWLYNNSIGRTYEDLVAAQGEANVPSTANLVCWHPLNSRHPSGAGKDVHGSLNLTLYNTPTDAPGIPAGQSPPGRVWRWSDLTGNGYHADQSTVSFQPQYIEGAVNNLPAILSDGVDDYLQLSFGADKAQPHDTWIVFKLNSVATQRLILDGIVVGKRHFLGNDLTPNYILHAGNNLSGGTPDTNWHIALITWASQSGGNSTLYIDGAQVIQANAGSNAISGITLFANYLLSSKGAYIAEFIQTSATHTTGDRLAIKAHLANKYNITVS